MGSVVASGPILPFWQAGSVAPFRGGRLGTGRVERVSGPRSGSTGGHATGGTWARHRRHPATAARTGLRRAWDVVRARRSQRQRPASPGAMTAGGPGRSGRPRRYHRSGRGRQSQRGTRRALPRRDRSHPESEQETALGGPPGPLTPGRRDGDDRRSSPRTATPRRRRRSPSSCKGGVRERLRSFGPRVGQPPPAVRRRDSRGRLSHTKLFRDASKTSRRPRVADRPTPRELPADDDAPTPVADPVPDVRPGRPAGCPGGGPGQEREI